MKTPKLRFLSLHFACLCEISDQNLGDLCLTYHQKMAPKQHENISDTVTERLNEKRCENLNKKGPLCQEWDSNPRLHSETSTLATIQTVKEFRLESGGLTARPS